VAFLDFLENTLKVDSRSSGKLALNTNLSGRGIADRNQMFMLRRSMSRTNPQKTANPTRWADVPEETPTVINKT